MCAILASSFACAPGQSAARFISVQSARRVVGVQAPRAPERAAQRFSSGLTALRCTASLISCRQARWSPCFALCVVLTVVAWCGDPLCCWVSCMVPSALDGWIILLGKFCALSLGPCRTRSPFLFHSRPAFLEH